VCVCSSKTIRYNVPPRVSHEPPAPVPRCNMFLAVVVVVAAAAATLDRRRRCRRRRRGFYYCSMLSFRCTRYLD